MKWIGQHIWSFISRFRDDVYLEDLADPGADTDKFLVVDANDKVGYRTGAEVLSDIGGSSAGSLTIGGHSVADIDIGSEFEDEDDHVMSSGAIKEYVGSHYTWNHNASYGSISNSNTEYKYRGSTGSALSRSTTDPTSLDAANANGCFWIAPADGAITRVDIQGETNANDTYQLRFYKAGASANASTVTLTHMITTPTITTNTDKTFNAFFTISSGGDFSARDRIWFFLQKQTNNHNQTGYFNLHVTGTIG